MLAHMHQESEGPVSDAAQTPVLPDFSRTTNPPFTAYSGIKFDADGDIYARDGTATWQKVGTWLLVGTNTDFSVSRTIDSGTLETDAGAGPLQLNADRIYDVRETLSEETHAAAGTFTIENWNGGTPNVTYDARQYSFSASVLP